jgi:ATP adenylyltransferase
MNYLYAPWRNQYVRSTDAGKSEDSLPKDCPFCVQYAARKDDHYFILKRTEHHFIMMNAYPYNAGHLLIITNHHVAHLEDLSRPARADFFELATGAATLLKKVLHAQGINIGLNLGRAAGAGIPAHLHLHVLPRWIGDTNFLPVFGETKQVGVDFKELYEQLKEPFAAMTL